MHTYTIHTSLLALCNCNMFRPSNGQFPGVLLIHFHSQKYNHEDKLIQEQILGENNPLFILGGTITSRCSLNWFFIPL
jgi:hypothetical protein